MMIFFLSIICYLFIYSQDCDSPTNFCVGPTENHTSIASALSSVTSGNDKILIKGGTYVMNIIIRTGTTSVTGGEIMPYGTDTVILIHNYLQLQNNMVVVDGRANWKIHNGNGSLTFKTNENKTYTQGAGFFDMKSTAFLGPFDVLIGASGTVMGIYYNGGGATDFGLQLYGVNFNVIDPEIHYYSYFVRFAMTSANIDHASHIKDCVFHHVRLYGIYIFELCFNVIMEGNYFYSTKGTPVQLTLRCDHLFQYNIEGHVFQNNIIHYQQGATVGGWGVIWLYRGSNCRSELKVRNNLFVLDDDYSMLVKVERRQLSSDSGDGQFLDFYNNLIIGDQVGSKVVIENPDYSYYGACSTCNVRYNTKSHTGGGWYRDSSGMNFLSGVEDVELKLHMSGDENPLDIIPYYLPTRVYQGVNYGLAITEDFFGNLRNQSFFFQGPLEYVSPSTYLSGSCLGNLEYPDCNQTCKNFYEPDPYGTNYCHYCPPNFDWHDNCNSCYAKWEGPLCDYCPVNWDYEENCEKCENRFDINSDCTICMYEYDVKTNCTECLGYYTTWSYCQTCSLVNGNDDCSGCKNGTYYDTIDNCDDCPPYYYQTTCDRCANGRENFDPEDDCFSSCINHYEPPGCSTCAGYWINECTNCPPNYEQTNCLECDASHLNYDPENGCTVCLDNFKAGCTECEGYYTLVSKCATCPTYYEQSNCLGCDASHENYDPENNCYSSCINHYSHTSGCTVCEGYYTDISLCIDCLDTGVGYNVNCDDCAVANYDPEDGCFTCKDWWGGANCDECPFLSVGGLCVECENGNDPATNCSCADNFKPPLCTSCINNYNWGSGCTSCLAHYSEVSECTLCEGYYTTGSGCVVCPANYEQSTCLGCDSSHLLFDPEDDCTSSCVDYWEISNDCTTCPSNMEQSQCKTCLNSKDPASGCLCDLNHSPPDCTSCINHFIYPGCTECQNHFSESSKCSECEDHFSLDSECTKCEGYWELSTDCSTCPSGYNQDCDGCFKTNYDPKGGCTSCKRGFTLSSDCVEKSKIAGIVVGITVPLILVGVFLVVIGVVVVFIVIMKKRKASSLKKDIKVDIELQSVDDGSTKKDDEKKNAKEKKAPLLPTKPKSKPAPLLPAKKAKRKAAPPVPSKRKV